MAKCNLKPKHSIQEMENITFALDALKHKGIKLVNIGAADIHSCRPSATLGLVWTLILTYQIGDRFVEPSPLSHIHKGTGRMSLEQHHLHR